MKHRYISFLLSLLITPSFGQSVLIEYDYLNPQNARWRYESGRDTIYHQQRIIRVRRDATVRVRLQNVNTDAIQSELVVRRSVNADSVVISSLLKVVGTYAAPAGLDLKALLELKSRGGVAPTMRYAPMQIDLETARQFPTAAVADIDASIRERLAEIAKWRTVHEQMRVLHYSQTTNRSELLRQCREQLAQLTASAPDLFDNDQQARLLLSQVALENAEYLRYALTLLERKVSQAQPASRGDDTSPDFNQFMVNEAIRQHRKVITSNLDEQLTAMLHETLNHYQALARNTFTTTLTTTVDRRSEALVMQFYDTTPTATTVSSGSPRRTMRTDRFTLQPPGQWQLSTSIGLSFLRFSQRLQSYALLGNKIVATEQDLLTPVVAGYLQLLPRQTGSVRMGLHVGVGVPLTDVRGVCFQLGPSLVLGRQNALSLNAGLFTARATRLSAGLLPGDTFTGTLPTVTRYEWGYHAGISFQFGLRR